MRAADIQLFLKAVLLEEVDQRRGDLAVAVPGTEASIHRIPWESVGVVAFESIPGLKIHIIQDAYCISSIECSTVARNFLRLVSDALSQLSPVAIPSPEPPARKDEKATSFLLL